MVTANLTMDELLRGNPMLRQAIIFALTRWDGHQSTEGRDVPVCLPFLTDRIEHLVKHFVDRALEEDRKRIVMDTPDVDAPIATKWREPERPVAGSDPLDELEEVCGGPAGSLLSRTDIVHTRDGRCYITTAALFSLIRTEFSAKQEPDPAWSAIYLLETRVRMLLYDRRLRHERDARLRGEMLALAGTISAKAGEIDEAKVLLERAEKLLKGARE